MGSSQKASGVSPTLRQAGLSPHLFHLLFAVGEQDDPAGANRFPDRPGFAVFADNTANLQQTGDATGIAPPAIIALGLGYVVRPELIVKIEMLISQCRLIR